MAKKQVKRNNKSKAKQAPVESLAGEVTGVIFMVIGVLLGLSLYTSGGSAFIAAVNKFVFGLFGMPGYALPVFIVILGVLIIAAKKIRLRPSKLLSLLVGILGILFLFHLFPGERYDTNAGYSAYIHRAYYVGSEMHIGTGGIGAVLCFPVHALLGKVGGIILSFGMVLISVMLLTRLSLKKVGMQAANVTKKAAVGAKEAIHKASVSYEEGREKREKLRIERENEREQIRLEKEQREKEQGGPHMLIILEGVAMCFILLMVCIIGIQNGPVGAVYFFEPEVQERVVQLGLTTKAKIKRDYAIAGAALFLPVLLLVPAMVYFVNGARTFGELFWQMTAVLMIMTLFDRIFIDWYWVGHTKAWIIPGTEDLMPYIPRKTMIGKWVGCLVGFPLIAAILAAVMTLLAG